MYVVKTFIVLERLFMHIPRGESTGEGFRPHRKHKAVNVLSSSCLEPLRKHKASNVGPSSDR